MSPRAAVCAAALWLLWPASVYAAGQAPPSSTSAKEAKAPTGTLTGTVYCADTNMPARLASIYLVHISDNSFGSQSYGETDLEGRFAADRIPEGTYYVVAVLPGYLNLLSAVTEEHLDELSDEERKSLLAQIQNVSISANQPAQTSIRLERGAEIDGTVAYDDDSPGIGLRIHYELKSNSPDPTFGIERRFGSTNYSRQGPPMTDDRGHFRIMGMPPGTYLVSTVLPSLAAERPSNRLTQMIDAETGGVVVYAGGSLRASKADLIKVEAGGASKDVDITIPLSRLHTVRGQVVVKSTGQAPPNASVALLYSDTREIVRAAMAPDGAFEIYYVPEDKFILEATAIAEPPPKALLDDEYGAGAVSGGFFFSMNPNPETSGELAEIPVTVTGDVDHLVITVPDPPTRKRSPSGASDEGSATPAGSLDNPQ